MWVTKISFNATKHSSIARYMKKRNLRILVFPLSWTYKEKGVILNITGVLYGNEKNKKLFLKDWKKDKENRLFNIDLSGDFFVGTVKEYPEAKTVYNENIVYTQPWLIDEEGKITLVFSSFEKKYLEKVIKTFEKFYQVQIHYIKQEKIKNISFKSQAPDLTEKQKSAINLAIKNRYYNYPRKTSIEKLAKLSNLSFSTFHAHLRKAEQKLMPFYFSK